MKEYFSQYISLFHFLIDFQFVGIFRGLGKLYIFGKVIASGIEKSMSAVSILLSIVKNKSVFTEKNTLKMAILKCKYVCDKYIQANASIDFLIP